MGWSKAWRCEEYDGEGWRSIPLPTRDFCAWGMEFCDDRLVDPGFWVDRKLEEIADQGFPEDASPEVKEQAEHDVLYAREELSPLPHGFAWVLFRDVFAVDWSRVEGVTDENRHLVEAWLAKLRSLGSPERHRFVFWWNPP